MTVTRDTAPAASVTAAARARSSRVLLVLGVTTVVALLIVSALTRSPDTVPFGSDHDEYRIVAEQLASLQGPVVAGVEGTKYPLGYPALLAVAELTGLDVPAVAIVLNIAAVGAIAGLAALTLRRLGGLAQFAGAAFVAISPGLWDSVYSIMPDTLLALVTAAIVAFVARRRWSGDADAGSDRDGEQEPGVERPRIAGLPERRERLVVARRASETPVRDIAVLTVLAAVATALKSVGVLVGLGASLGLVVAPGRAGRLFWLPGAAGAAVTGLMALAVAAYPAHTTGYSRVFWRIDPFDASAGSAGVADVAGRVFERADAYLIDVGRSLVGPGATEGAAILAAVVLVTVGLVGLWRTAENRRVALAVGTGIVVVYSAFLLVWPFSSPRFGLPLLPIAATGLGWVAAALAGSLARAPRDRLAPAPAPTPWRWWGAAVLVAAVLGGHAAWGLPAMAAQGDAEHDKWTSLHAATADAVSWIRDNVPADDAIVSLDYREIARSLDRPVQPLSYTSDVEALWQRTVACGDWLVVIRGLYGQRDATMSALVTAHTSGLDLAVDGEHVRIFRIVADDSVTEEGRREISCPTTG